MVSSSRKHLTTFWFYSAKSLAGLALPAMVALGICSAQSAVEPPAGVVLLLTAKGEGAQVYTCSSGRWILKAPDARLLDEHGQVIGTHFAGPTWRLTDGSEVKGKLLASRPASDATSVPWLLLQAVPASGSGTLANVGYIGRTETHGGAADSTPCTGGEERVPYTARYSFYIPR